MLNSSKFIDESIMRPFEALLLKRLPERNALLLLLAMKTGARASELLGLTNSSINFTNGTVFIKAVKGSKDRELPLPDTLLNALRLHYSVIHNGVATSPSTRLFPISYPRLVQIWHKHRPCNAKFHALRHSRAVSLYKATRNIHLVKQVLGHSSIVTSMIYLEYVEGQEALRKVMCD